MCAVVDMSASRNPTSYHVIVNPYFVKIFVLLHFEYKIDVTIMALIHVSVLKRSLWGKTTKVTNNFAIINHMILTLEYDLK